MSQEPDATRVTKRVQMVPLLQLGEFHVRAIEYDIAPSADEPEPVTMRRLELQHQGQLIARLRPLQVEEFTGRLLAWLWGAHTDETRELAAQVTRALCAWRDGALDPRKAAEMLQLLGVVRSIHTEPREGP